MGARAHAPTRSPPPLLHKEDIKDTTHKLLVVDGGRECQQRDLGQRHEKDAGPQPAYRAREVAPQLLDVFEQEHADLPPETGRRERQEQAGHAHTGHGGREGGGRRAHRSPYAMARVRSARGRPPDRQA